jgi:hypothetical protein
MKTAAKDVPDLFTQKCEVCSAFPDFSEGRPDDGSRQIKADLLSDILSGLSDPAIGRLLKVEQISMLFKMIATNLFRKYPHVSLEKKPEFVLDREYSHIHLVYQILDSVISFRTIPKPLVAPSVNQAFINSVFGQICAYDAREQRHVIESTMLLVQQFPWAALPLFRRICRFCGYLAEEFRFPHAVPSIVAVLTPLLVEVVKDVKTATKLFRSIVLPLHKCESYALYHAKLARMVIHIVGLEKALLREFVFFITKHWAVRSREKCSLVFDEVAQVCDTFSEEFDAEMAVKLVSKISMFFMDPAGDVSQQSLFILTSSGLRGILKLCPDRLLRRLLASATAVMTTHWVADTRQLARDFVAELAVVDPRLTMALIGYQADTDNEESQRKKTWRQIIGKASE